MGRRYRQTPLRRRHTLFVGVRVRGGGVLVRQLAVVLRGRRVLLGVFVTALYTFRLLFMTFHGPERFREATAAHGAEEHDGGGPGHGHGADFL